MSEYIGMVSSDWSQCLSPNRPFDAFIFHYPDLRIDLDRIFYRYTANEMSLTRAADEVKALLPALPSPGQMDDYLDSCFDTYAGVPELIRWCRENRILFMINTTGFMGYFQRALERSLLPAVAVLSAHPMVRFNSGQGDPGQIKSLFEIDDKAHNTASVAEHFSIAHHKIVLMGDSGGDGPHFEWGARMNATLIGCMTKPSLDGYCRDRGVLIDHHYGYTYSMGEKISMENECGVNFQSCVDIIAHAIGIDR